MGKKRIVKTNKEQILKEAEKREEELIKKAKKKKQGRIIERANIYIRASYNNTSIYVADENGDIVAWSTAGSAGFKGPRKATPYAATQVVNILMDKLEKVDMKQAQLFVQGIGSGRDSAVRALTGKNLNITAIKDITPLPHNGCRPPKRRRV
jgi:small subunit ribosomal protein S11